MFEIVLIAAFGLIGLLFLIIRRHLLILRGAAEETRRLEERRGRMIQRTIWAVDQTIFEIEREVRGGRLPYESLERARQILGDDLEGKKENAALDKQIKRIYRSNLTEPLPRKPVRKQFRSITEILKSEHEDFGDYD